MQCSSRTMVTNPFPPHAGHASRFAGVLFMASPRVAATSPLAGLALELVRQLLQLPTPRAQCVREPADNGCRRRAETFAVGADRFVGDPGFPGNLPQRWGNSVE